MTSHPSVPPGSLLGGKFRIERLLGTGAMGAVYAIHHELTRHQRALKLLHPAAQNIPDVVRRFLNEASAAGRAGNPHLVETFDAGSLPTGEPYLVMELLEGETLGAVIHRKRRLDPAEAAELVAQAAEGMEAAHRAGIIHRDLKPENLFVTTRDGASFIKIMDFGVSKFASGSAGGLRATQAGMIYGSPAYMSPEQLQGRVDLDARTDVFALGVVLYECLSGVLPFDAPSIEGLLVRILDGEFTPLEELCPELPWGLVEVVRQALAPDREQRIASASALAKALAPYRALVMPIKHHSVDAFAQTFVSLVPKSSVRPRPSRRHLIAIVLAVITIGAALWLIQLRSPTESAPQQASDSNAIVVSAVTTAPPAAPTPETPTAVTIPAVTATAGVSHDEASLPAHPAHKLATSKTSPHPEAPTSATALPSATSTPPEEKRLRPAQDLGLREDNPFR